MSLQDTDNFIVSDTTGTNHRVSYADLLAKLQADGLGAGGGSMDLLAHGVDMIDQYESLRTISIPSNTKYLVLNSSGRDGGAADLGNVYVSYFTGTTAEIRVEHTTGFMSFSYFALG